MTSPALQRKMLALLEEARREVESGTLESLAVIGRKPATTQYLSLFVHEFGADICGLFGFLMVCLQKSVEIQKDVEQVEEPESHPAATRTRVVH